MATVKISALTAAITIDATADYLPIVQASSATTKKINRNTLLGITGAPIGTTDTQVLTNKTIGNTNTLTLKDTLFTLQDDGDTTKQAKFQLSGLTTATTRTYTLPDGNLTLATVSGTETLTNKTLTSPTITGGSIDNTTITVDSISGHTSATVVTVGGVQLNNGQVATANAVVTNSINDSAVTPAKLLTGTGSGWPLASWTPTWTNLTVAASTVVAKYVQVGKLVFFRVSVTLAGGNVPSGSISFSLPVTAVSYGNSQTVLGGAHYEDAGVASYVGYTELSSTTTATFLITNVAATYPTGTALSSAIPFTFANGDALYGEGWYEAA